MAIISFRPTTPSLRFAELQKRDITQKRPEKKLTTSYSKSAGRNCYGRVTSRRRGGGHKRLRRIVDFRRNKFDIPANVQAIEYDPGRTSHIALVAYADGEKRYIIAPEGLKVGDKIFSSQNMISFDIGNTMPLEFIPPSTRLHAVELLPGKGAQLARSAGNSLELINIEGSHAQLKMPSGEIRLVSKKCLATIGSVSNAEHSKVVIGKAGRNRWKGKRPRVRGVVMNPVDHPNGGGEAKSKGGGGRQMLVSPWGQLAKGFPTRRKSKESNSLILVRRNGRKFKR
ncbi:50S ribosomal protein L2 [Candidatus Pelagisphaera phototrophica]|uniref:50S ribosomal protein L2 n=1 Tax=Candidatus Pelagisphaera phototrophica TaxID=2684113 RepID=UPI001A09CB9C|nr:50S ribosomal protein L2 [Candidatus Pelagisphaera phototrophica]QXD31925.1 50S ribosomal protein L2 [Candidatus Pelagisphaera phototrophica]